jgi:hypothetical protein
MPNTRAETDSLDAIEAPGDAPLWSAEGAGGGEFFD